MCHPSARASALARLEARISTLRPPGSGAGATPSLGDAPMTTWSRAGLPTEAAPGALVEEHAALLEQQAATSNVIQAIGRPGFDLEPIFETVAEHAVRLCHADAAQIFV